jgi:isoquinoline 1-oxidoreductase beta subunit
VRPQDIRLSRRAVLQGTGTLVIALTLPMGLGRAQAPAAPPPVDPNAFVRVGADDVVTVIVKHIEFGQGPNTGLATLVAEEMDADWAKVRAESAPADVRLYANLNMGIQGTGGSSAIANSYEQMRRAGAMARAMLVQAAAAEWGVQPAALTVEKSVIRHAASGREGGFGQFAAAAAKLPPPPNVTLKDPADFTLIGRDRAGIKLDSVAKSNGTAKFTIDIAEPEMLTVVVAHPERFGAKLASFDAAEALRVKGVVAVKEIPTGVAVYGRGTWPALKGRKALKLTWDDSGAETRDSEAMLAEYKAQASTKGTVAAEHGDADAALAAGEVIEADYLFPFLAHAPMEPLNGYLVWNAEGAQGRMGSQMQTGDQAGIAEVLGLKPEQVTIETMLAGGSFGRRATPTGESARELAEAAKAIGPGIPVKLIRTREDDIQGGFYRPMFAHRLRGAVRDGKIVAWTDTLCGHSFIRGSPFEAMIQNGVDATMVEGAREIPYDIPAFRCDVHTAETKVPTLWWRSVGHTHTGYAVETFVDRLLEAAGKDPVAGRLELMGKAPRAAGALRAVAELADWNGPGPNDGRARGVAVVESFGSFVAEIAEVSLGEDGLPVVHKVWCAVDCGVAVNPDVVRAQMEGGIGYGLGAALFSEVELAGGKVVQSNFNDYRSLRIHEMPAIEVTIVPSTEKPTGVGEPGTPPIAPAVANAMVRLGRERPTRLPFARSVA